MSPETQKTRFFKFTIKQWLWLLFVVPGLLFFIASVGIILYATLPWPTGQAVNLPAIRADSEELIILAHGKGDNPSSWADGFAAELGQSTLNPRQQVIVIDWEEYSTDLFRSTLNGRRIGRDLGVKLNNYSHLKRLHLIGHSAGSFVVYGLCESLKEQKDRVFIHTTYLDPVSIYAGLDWGFGQRSFGRCADISDAYIDRDDVVPGSNEPLENTHTFDVTTLKVSAGYEGQPHLWPVVYYRQAVIDKTLPYWRPDQAGLEKYPVSQTTVY